MTFFNQLSFPPPTFTEDNIIDLSTKVYIITDAVGDTGLRLAKLLYGLHATVYIGSPSADMYAATVSIITHDYPSSQGALKPFIADFADLVAIKQAAEAFLRVEYRLDVLFLNNGVATISKANKPEDVRNVDFGVDCLAPFLLTKLLYPLMNRVSTHFCHPNTSIRIVYISSHLGRQTPGGISLFSSGTSLSYLSSSLSSSYSYKELPDMPHHIQTRAGVYLLAHEFSVRHSSDPKIDEHGIASRNPTGVLHVCVDLGPADSNAERYRPPSLRNLIIPMSKGSKYGVYTMLYAGIAPGIQDGDFIVPYGRKGEAPEHVGTSKVVKDGQDRSVSARLYEWCETQIGPFM